MIQDRPLRLLVTGSRHWTDAGVVRDVLDGYAASAAKAGAPGVVLVHGACYPGVDPITGLIPARSADWLAHLWATTLPHPLPVTEEPHPADWARPCDSSCKPGHRRRRRDGAEY